MQSLCAFLNTDGGWLFFGITPKLEILGQKVADSTQQEIAREVRKFEPAINLPMELIEVPDRMDSYVIGFHAEAAKFGDAPYTYDGRAFYRVESTTAQMPRSMFEERLRRSDPKRFAWESQTPDTLHFEDLDEKKIRGCVMYGISQGRMPESSSTENTMMLLEKVGMVENGKIKNSAAVLFTKRPQSYPQFSLRMARFRGKDKMVFIDNMRAEGNYFDLLDAGMAFFFKHLNLSGVVKGFRREERLEIPAEALREALTNALCHRLLDSPGGSVGIAIYDDRVEIENTGHLPNELTVETIKKSHRSFPQNPIMASALYKTGFLESWGTGVSRMVEACKAVGLPEPEYGTDGLFVWITFKRPESMQESREKTESHTESIQKTPQKSGQKTERWPESWPEKWPEIACQIMDAIAIDKTITIAKLETLTSLGHTTLKKIFREMQSEGIICRVGPDKGGYWEIIQDKTNEK